LSHPSQDGLQSTSLEIQSCVNFAEQFHTPNILVFTSVMTAVEEPEVTTANALAVVQTTEVPVQKPSAHQKEKHDFMHRFYRRTMCGLLVRQ
jgi:hypothetical protein